jgi:cobalamin biosynthesis protein CbiG
MNQNIVIGIGSQRGVAPATVETAIDAVLARLGAVTVRCLASHERKADEPALLALGAARGWPIQFYSAAQLSAVVVPNPSARVAAEMVTPSVAEAAALLASGNATLLIEKCAYFGSDGKAVTLAVAACR